MRDPLPTGPGARGYHTVAPSWPGRDGGLEGRDIGADLYLQLRWALGGALHLETGVAAARPGPGHHGATSPDGSTALLGFSRLQLEYRPTRHRPAGPGRRTDGAPRRVEVDARRAAVWDPASASRLR